MSGHSKWSQIRHKKGIADAKKGALFTKHTRLITLSARKGGGDPQTNSALRMAIESARADNLPMANIERAIKRGTGELKDQAEIHEVIYEGYGPGGTALYIQAVTDNRNRAVSNIRTILSKHGGRMGETGCVAYLFEKKGVIIIDPLDRNPDEIELLAIDAGAEDIKREAEEIEVYTAPQNFIKTKESLEKQGLKIKSSEISHLPKNEIRIEDEETARKVLKLMEVLEEDEDVADVSSNFDIPEELVEKITYSPNW